MRKNLFMIVSLSACVVLYACKGGDSPDAIAEKFLKALYSYDFETARKYGTEDTGKLLDMMSGFSKLMPDSNKKEIKFEILNVKVDGDKAVVMYKDEGKEAQAPLSLMRVNGKWKVNMTKESINGTETGSGLDSGATETDSGLSKSQVPDSVH